MASIHSLKKRKLPVIAVATKYNALKEIEGGKSQIETLLDFSLFMDTDDVKKISMKLSSLIESELSKNFKQASIKDYFTCNV